MFERPGELDEAPADPAASPAVRAFATEFRAVFQKVNNAPTSDAFSASGPTMKPGVSQSETMGSPNASQS